MDVNSLPKTVTRQRRDCDFNPDPKVSAPESSTRLSNLSNHLATEPLCSDVAKAFFRCRGRSRSRTAETEAAVKAGNEAR